MNKVRVLVIASPDAPWLAPLKKAPAQADIRISDDIDTLTGAAPEVDIILNTNSGGAALRQIWPLASNLKWVHSLSAGVENQVFPELAESPVPLTNARGVYKESLGEWVIGAILFFAKDYRRLLRNQADHQWEQFDCKVIAGQTVGIVGYGEIGRAVARRAKALDMQVIGCRRRPEPDPYADEVLPNEQSMEVMRRSDYVVVAAPLTPETKGLVSREHIAAMKPDGVIMNVGRGPVIDEEALVEALREKRILGAALDVFDEEPLPATHSFWDFDNVLLSPHCADHVEGWLESAVEFFVSNLQRFLAGEQLQNIVNKRAGY